jgi:hypothetical protein
MNRPRLAALLLAVFWVVVAWLAMRYLAPVLTP